MFSHSFQLKPTLKIIHFYQLLIKASTSNNSQLLMLENVCFLDLFPRIFCPLENLIPSMGLVYLLYLLIYHTNQLKCIGIHTINSPMDGEGKWKPLQKMDPFYVFHRLPEISHIYLGHRVTSPVLKGTGLRYPHQGWQKWGKNCGEKTGGWYQKRNLRNFEGFQGKISSFRF